jgi:hypothetical protein
MRRLSPVIGVLIVGLVLCRGSVPIVYAADFILSGASDCAAIGIWNAAMNTCTLSGNVYGSIEIRADGVTLDGNGYAIIGPSTIAYGVYIYGYHTGITEVVEEFGCSA